MKRFAMMLLASILAVVLLVGCDGEANATPRGPIILSVVTATPDGTVPTPVPGYSQTAGPGHPTPSMTPD
jgi:hypothetical protein